MKVLHQQQIERQTISFFLVSFQGLIVLLGVAVVSSTPADYSEYAAPQILHAPVAAKIVVPEPVVSDT